MADPATTSQAPISPLEAWASEDNESIEFVKPQKRLRQIIAFNDPSDALTFEVPEVPNAKVVNLYDRNSITWLWSFENPIAAHTGHSKNAAVLRTLFERRDRQP